MERPNHLVVFDGSNIFVRCFFGMPKRYAEDGTPVWAVHGFIEQLLSYWKQLRPTHWVVAWDTPRSASWRRELYPEYKGTRKESDPELSAQWPLVIRAVEDLAVPSIVRDGYEADDVMATLVRRAAEEQWATTLVSSDKDCVQLLDLHPQLTLVSPAHGREPQTREMLLKRHGQIGMAFRDMQAIQGDASDNVPGVPGVGKVGALKLVQEIGLDAFIAQAQSGRRFTGAFAKVAAHLPSLLLSRKLVTLSTDVELPEDLESFLRCRRAPAGAFEKIGTYAGKSVSASGNGHVPEKSG